MNDEKMTFKERFYWIVAFILHGGGIGDVNIAKVPLWVMYPWFLCVLLWHYLPVVILRKTYNDLKQEKENGEYYVKWMNQDRERSKLLESKLEQLELHLRQTGQLHVLREIEKKVNDPDWDFPQYRYQSDADTKPRSTMSTPSLRRFKS